MKKYIIVLVVALFLVHCNSADAQKLKHSKIIHIKIKEPSDVAVSFDKQHLYIVSDDGILCETDLQGNVSRCITENLTDAEGVYADATYIYVADESPRLISLFDVKTMTHVKSIYLPYGGGRNKGYESLTYDTDRKVYYTLTEKDPLWLITLDEDLKLKEQYMLHEKGDVSSATYHNGKLWLLCDEKREIWVMNVTTKSIEKRFSINVWNPEGLAFLPDGQLIVVSDDRQLMYFYPNPENLSDAH